MIFAGNPRVVNHCHNILKPCMKSVLFLKNKFKSMGMLTSLQAIKVKLQNGTYCPSKRKRWVSFFIDEAYSLQPSSNDGYLRFQNHSACSISPLLENNRSDTVIILAGYVIRVIQDLMAKVTSVFLVVSSKFNLKITP